MKCLILDLKIVGSLWLSNTFDPSKVLLDCEVVGLDEVRVPLEVGQVELRDGERVLSGNQQVTKTETREQI